MISPETWLEFLLDGIVSIIKGCELAICKYRHEAYLLYFRGLQPEVRDL